MRRALSFASTLIVLGGMGCGGSKPLESPSFGTGITPGLPSHVTAVTGSGFAVVHWAAPPNENSGQALQYVVKATPRVDLPVWLQTNDTSALLNGLLNDTTYSITVAAKNQVGAGPESAPVSITPRSRCERSFVSYRTYSLGDWPVSVAVGDFNGDGHPDIAVANEGFGPGKGSVSLLFNDGTGGFEHRADYRVADYPETLVVADFNGDGHLDLVTGGTKETLLLNDGAGTFGSRIDFGVGSESLAVAPLKGDRLPDLVSAYQIVDSPMVLLNHGNSVFGPFLKHGQGRRPLAVALGDLNGDGRPDLVVAYSGDSTLGASFGRGDGSFDTEAKYNTIRGPISLSLADFDGDGTLDVAVGNTDAQSNRIAILLNRGGGTAFSATDIQSGLPATHLTTADINADGTPDLLYTSAGQDAFGFVVNTGGGTFSPPTLIHTGPFPASIATADVNGDGYADAIVVTSADHSAMVFINVCREP
jgi:hypothetical protein